MDAYLKLAEQFIDDFYSGDCDWTKVPSHLLLVSSVVDSALHYMDEIDKLTESMNNQPSKKLLLQDTTEFEHFHHLLFNDIFYIAMHWYLNDEATLN